MTDKKTMDDRSYRWDASDYAGHSAAQYKWARELVDKLDLKGDEAILDIGCGDGNVSAVIAGRLPKGFVVGIDSSQEMIELASRSYPNEEFPNLSYQLMDARHISFSKKFDVAFSNAALHWVTDHRPVLSGVRACLNKGGRVLFQMGGKGNGDEILRIIDLIAVHEPWRRYIEGCSFPWAFFDPEEYGCLLAEAGIEQKRVELIPKDMVQRGKEGLEGWIRTTWLPYIEKIPNHLRQAFISGIADEYIRTHPLDADGFVHVRMTRLEVEGINP